MFTPSNVTTAWSAWRKLAWVVDDGADEDRCLAHDRDLASCGDDLTTVTPGISAAARYSAALTSGGAMDSRSRSLMVVNASWSGVWPCPFSVAEAMGGVVQRAMVMTVPTAQRGSLPVLPEQARPA